jgi:hypothetical protein
MPDLHLQAPQPQQQKLPPTTSASTASNAVDPQSHVPSINEPQTSDEGIRFVSELPIVAAIPVMPNHLLSSSFEVADKYSSVGRTLATTRTLLSMLPANLPPAASSGSRGGAVLRGCTIGSRLTSAAGATAGAAWTCAGKRRVIPRPLLTRRKPIAAGRVLSIPERRIESCLAGRAISLLLRTCS